MPLFNSVESSRALLVVLYVVGLTDGWNSAVDRLWHMTNAYHHTNGRTILVADDEESAHVLIQRAFHAAQSSYALQIVTNGERGNQIFEGVKGNLFQSGSVSHAFAGTAGFEDAKKRRL